MLFLKHSQAPLEKLDALSQRRILAYDQQLMAVEVTLEAGGVGAPHAHPHHQVDYLVSGCVEFEVAGKKQLLSPGDSVVIPPDTVHGAKALEKSVLLDIFSPMREDFVDRA